MVNYVQPMTPEDVVVAMRMAKSEAIYSDESTLNNAEKWSQINAILKANDITADVDYEAEFLGADADRCRAAWFMADIRTQVLRITLDNVRDYRKRLALHHLWLINKQWTVRLRDRAIAFRALDDLQTELRV